MISATSTDNTVPAAAGDGQAATVPEMDIRMVRVPPNEARVERGCRVCRPHQACATLSLLQQGMRAPVPRALDLPGAARIFGLAADSHVEVTHHSRQGSGGHAQSAAVRDNGCMCALMLVKASGARPHPILLTVGAGRLESGAPSRLVERSNYGAFAREQAGTRDRHISGSRLPARILRDDLLTHPDGRMDWGEGYNLLSLPTSDNR